MTGKITMLTSFSELARFWINSWLKITKFLLIAHQDLQDAQQWL
jgi:hypothetical protein